MNTQWKATAILALALLIAGCQPAPQVAPVVVAITATPAETIVVVPGPTATPDAAATERAQDRDACRRSAEAHQGEIADLAAMVDEFADRPQSLNAYQAEFLGRVQDARTRAESIEQHEGTAEAHDSLLQAIDELTAVGQNAPPGGGTAAQVSAFREHFAAFELAYYDAKTAAAEACR